MYRKVRLACAEGMSQREAARHFNISRDSVAKMMAFSVPVAYGHRDVWIRGYVGEVVIGCGGEVIARHLLPDR